MPPSSASRITTFSFMALPCSRVIAGPAPAATPLPFRFAVPPVGGLADETHNTHAANPSDGPSPPMPSSTPLAAPGMPPLALLCDLFGFGPSPAAILFPIPRRSVSEGHATPLLS